ncbi:hypothetical protein C8K30_103102 [Promicromonospora sp. AC04]|uniref:hypothetical protein n=1 Tax=Promicromonospora sp. AC04 TaxID=2135723 RepID=UPI000D47E22D|nr:hypothetical protein [Promicromonospora sp. AC04]PUB28682.1 hypothetical protein C8K30_103102 [Promicromonospora sp. AC04]
MAPRQQEQRGDRQELERRVGGRPGTGAPVIDLDAHRRDRERRQATAGAEAIEEPPGWLLRSPAYRVVESLAPWAGIADGGSFAALLDDPIDAHLILTRFPSHALARSFCGGPTLGQVGLAITREPHQIKARVWVGGYGTPDEGISVAAVYVRFEGAPSDTDARAGQHPALWAWVTDRLGYDGEEPRWPEPDEVVRDRTDVRDPGVWWRVRWGPSRAPFARQPPAGVGSLPVRRPKAVPSPEPDRPGRREQRGPRDTGGPSGPPGGS